MRSFIRAFAKRTIGEGIFFLILLSMLVTGCATKRQTGALAGSGIGALAGQVIGGNTAATLIGAGVGAGVGYLIGNEMDKKKSQEMTQAGHGYRADTKPLGGTKWEVISVTPSDITSEYTSKVLEFGRGGYVVTTTTKPDGKVQVSEENYRVVGDTLIINQPGYLVNAKYRIAGNEMIMDAQNFKATLTRLH